VIAFIFADLIVLPILGHLPQVLRLEGCVLPLRDVLRGHERSRAGRRASLRRAGSDP
jgi:hypothetical protein